MHLLKPSVEGNIQVCELHAYISLQHFWNMCTLTPKAQLTVGMDESGGNNLEV